MWLPRSWFALLLLFMALVLVSASAVMELLLAVVIGPGCLVNCSEPPNLGAVLHFTRGVFLLLLPFAVVRLYQWHPPSSKRIRWTVTAIVAAYCLWWLASRDLLGIMLSMSREPH